MLATGVLIGLRDHVSALQELRRVLRPAGFVGVRDADMDADIFTPTTPLLDQWWELRRRILLHNGGEPLGRHHGQRLLEAGFARVEESASAINAGALPETRNVGIARHVSRSPCPAPRRPGPPLGRRREP